MRAPFPHVERAVVVPRPALVISRRTLGPDGLLIWTLMITSAARPAWPGDVEVAQWQALGLRIPCRVRTAKIASHEAAAVTQIGQLDHATWQAVLREFKRATPL